MDDFPNVLIECRTCVSQFVALLRDVAPETFRVAPNATECCGGNSRPVRPSAIFDFV